MNFISFEFIAFLVLIFSIYYICPLSLRYIVLLAASLFFYWTYGPEKMVFLGVAAVVTWICGLAIEALRGTEMVRQTTGQKEAADNKGAALAVLLVGITLLMSMLVYAKAAGQIMAAFSELLHGEGITLAVIIPLGISYYTLAAIGYLADIYWKKDKAEKNPLKILLYLCYFPQILQGPIPKHRTLGIQLGNGSRFEYQRVCYGFQRVIWGFFKKLVIADRLALMVSQVFDHYLEYSGFVFWFGLAGAVFQLYADFSGCVDIALGISEVFGITLEENFKRPFYSVSAAEFWRRWHISLGTWFKDYVYMPLSTASWLMKLGKVCKKHFGRAAARNVITTVPLACVWILTGLWHGTGWDYLVWGLYWGCIIILSTWLAPVYKKINKRFGLTEDLGWWKLFRQFRTFGIYMVGRLLTIPGNLLTSRWIGRKMFVWNPWVLFDGTLFNLGWSSKDVLICLAALLILWKVSSLQEQGTCIRHAAAKWPLPIRWGFYYGAIAAVVIFGIYGSGASSSAFVYMQY